MHYMIKNLLSTFKPFKNINRINRITLINYAAMIIIIILVMLFWRNREGFYTTGMDTINKLINDVIERNRQDIVSITRSSLNNANAQLIYGTWKNRTTTAILNYVSKFIDYHGSASEYQGDGLGIKNAARLKARNTFTSNLPSSAWPYGLAIGQSGYRDYITATTYRDDIGGVVGATSTAPPETGPVTGGTFTGNVATGSITRDSSGGFAGCTFTISDGTGIIGNFIGDGRQCAFAGGIVTGGTLTGGTLSGGTLSGGTLTGGTIAGGTPGASTVVGTATVSSPTPVAVGGTFTRGSITGNDCTLTGGTLTGTLTGVTITGVNITENTITNGTISGTFSGTFTRAPVNVNSTFRVPQTNSAERDTFNSKLITIENELMTQINNWFKTHPNEDFTINNMFRDTYNGSMTGMSGMSGMRSPSIYNTDHSNGQWTSNRNSNQSTLIGQSYDTDTVGTVNTGMSPIAEYWRNKYYEQTLLTDPNVDRNSAMPYDTMSNEASFWRRKYEDQINGTKSGSILPYNSSTAYNILQNNGLTSTSSVPETDTNKTKTETVKSNNESCSASTDDMYMLKSKMVYMNPTQGSTSSTKPSTKTGKNTNTDTNTNNPITNYADSRDTKQAPFPPCPACDRCPEPAFDCKKVPNYKSVAINQYLPQPVLSSFSQFGM